MDQRMRKAKICLLLEEALNLLDDLIERVESEAMAKAEDLRGKRTKIEEIFSTLPLVQV